MFKHMEYSNKEDPGLSEEEFQRSQKELQKEIEIEGRKGLEKEACLYFEFENTERRDAAIRTINKIRNERREFDELFLYFDGCSVDPEREVGIKIKFSKNPKDIREKFEQLLTENGFAPKEEYKTLDGKPELGETRVNGY
jgi:hypothetical protein